MLGTMTHSAHRHCSFSRSSSLVGLCLPLLGVPQCLAAAWAAPGNLPGVWTLPVEIKTAQAFDAVVLPMRVRSRNMTRRSSVFALRSVRPVSSRLAQSSVVTSTTPRRCAKETCCGRSGIRSRTGREPSGHSN